MIPRVLILSSLFDFATDEVAYELEQSGVPYVRLNREQLAEHNLTLHPLSHRLDIEGPVGRYTIDEHLEAVLFRQPVFNRNSPGQPLTLSEQLERSQWLAFLRALSLFEMARWMNPPSATYLAESKPYQLSMALSCGFRVPNTVISNDVSAIRGLHPTSVAVKSLDSVLLRDHGDSLFTYTSICSPEELGGVGIQSAPVIAQEVLEPKTDLRVTIVGEQAFAVRILDDGMDIQGDWRLTPRNRLSYVDMELEDAVQDSCRKLVKRLGLAFGAIDLAVTADGVSFIEISPTGEWGWLSSPSRPIGRSIAEWLGQGVDRG